MYKLSRLFYGQRAQCEDKERNRNILLQIPKVKLDFTKNGLVFMGARLYNSLPKDIRESANDFENKVNSYFSRKS